MRKLQFKTQVVDKNVHVHVSGDVDAGNALALREQLEAALADTSRVMLLDLSGLKKMDSAGVAVLVEAETQLRLTGRRLALCGVPPAVAGMLELLGRFEMYGDLEEGLRRTRRVGLRLHDPTLRVKS
jgi:anti-anti-sigma factor